METNTARPLSSIEGWVADVEATYLDDLPETLAEALAGILKCVTAMREDLGAAYGVVTHGGSGSDVAYLEGCLERLAEVDLQPMPYDEALELVTSDLDAWLDQQGEEDPEYGQRERALQALADLSESIDGLSAVAIREALDAWRAEQ